jgi:hypothetical protein
MKLNLLLSMKEVSNALLVILLLLTSLYAQPDSSRSIYISRFSEPITIDGYLSEPAWKNAVVIKNFYTYRPVDGQSADEETAVLLGYDQTSLYIAFICFDPAPNLIRSSISKRDAIDDDDMVVLYLDTYNAGKETYHFSFNPDGIQADGIYIDMIAEDNNPDYIFFSKGHKFKKGYIVEAEIPFKSLRFPDSDTIIWGIAFARTIKHLDKDLIWPAISRNASSFVAQFGKLYGLYDINPGKHIEILPEVTAIEQGTLDEQQDSFVQENPNYDLGINLKIGLLSNLTMDMTYNPDFSQVEADADRIDVNRRFPLYYPEKRPFFLEGTNIFKTPINAVYTRRIVDPQFGAKLTGNIEGFDIGLLASIDDYYGSEEYLNSQHESFSSGIPADSAAATDSSQFFDTYKGQNTYHTIMRLRKEVWSYSNIGLLFTDFHLKDTYSRTYGIDGNFLIADDYALTFQALNSNTKNYFDPQIKSDPAFYLNLFRGSRTFNFQIFYHDVFPDFTAATGFLERESDYREGGLQVWYDIRSDDSFLQVIQPLLFVSQMYDHPTEERKGKKIESYIVPSVSFSARGQNTLQISYYRQFEEYLGSEFYKNQYYASISTKTLSWLYANLSYFWGDGIYYSYDPFLGKTGTINWSLEFKPYKNWATLISGSNYLFTGNNEVTSVRIVQDILRLRSVIQFTRAFSFRLILQRDNYYQDIELNTLVGWQPSPGTLVFLGYNDYFNQMNRNNYIRFANGFFFKFSYLFRF